MKESGSYVGISRAAPLLVLEENFMFGVKKL